MLRIVRFAVPLVVFGGVLGAFGLAKNARGEARAEARHPVHLLKTKSGITFQQTFDGKKLHAVVQSAQGNVPLRNGQYKLTNGGEIKVQDGIIVWDAFGVVEKVSKGAPNAIVDDVG